MRKSSTPILIKKAKAQREKALLKNQTYQHNLNRAQHQSIHGLTESVSKKEDYMMNKRQSIREQKQKQQESRLRIQKEIELVKFLEKLQPSVAKQYLQNQKGRRGRAGGERNIMTAKQEQILKEFAEKNAEMSYTDLHKNLPAQIKWLPYATLNSKIKNMLRPLTNGDYQEKEQKRNKHRKSKKIRKEKRQKDSQQSA